MSYGGSQNPGRQQTIGSLLVELRLHAGRSQREQAETLSHQAGRPVTRNDISRWEHQNRLPTPWRQEHIAASFGVQVGVIREAVRAARLRRRSPEADSSDISSQRVWSTTLATPLPEEVHRLNRVEVTGDWWASWQTYRRGVEKIATQPVHMQQDGEVIHIAATRRGLSAEEGGYLWTGELRFWDNEVFTGWYAASDGSTRSKGTMYLLMHPHRIQMTGQWVGLGYDGDNMTGHASFSRTNHDAESTVIRLIGGEPGSTPVHISASHVQPRFLR